MTMTTHINRPTGAFIAASWAALFIGAVTYIVGIWNATMPLQGKGYYLAVLMYGLFAAVSLQKSVRDRIEDIPVTALYFGLCWISLGFVVLLLTVGLWNAPFASTEKGYYAMSFLLSLFGAVTVQKNVRDLSTFKDEPVRAEKADPRPSPQS